MQRNGMWSTSCLVSFSSVGMFGPSVEFSRLVQQEFLLHFDRVHVKDLVTGLDPIHLPTAARIGVGNHSSLTVAPACEKEAQLLHQFRTFHICDESRFVDVAYHPASCVKYTCGATVHQKAQG